MPLPGPYSFETRDVLSDGRLTILGEGADFDRAGRRRRLPDIIHIELLELALI
jgi:hypothetical protein